MKSIRELYRIGTGPSSSHTMGPRKAAEIFLGKHPEAKAFQVTLYGSLAATGKGHMTDVAILDTLQPHAPTEIIWKAHVFYPFHPNGMTFKSLNEKGKVTLAILTKIPMNRRRLILVCCLHTLVLM